MGETGELGELDQLRQRLQEAEETLQALRSLTGSESETPAPADSHEQAKALRFVIDGANLGTWRWNTQTNETIFNETWATMLGYTLTELAPCDITTWECLTHPGDLERSYNKLKRCLKGTVPQYDCELRMRHKDGHWVWILDRGRVMTYDDAGQPLWMFGTHTDITRLKQAEATLQEREEQFQTLFMQTSVAVVIHDKDTGEFLEANPAALQAYGYDSLADMKAGAFWADPPYSAADALKLIHKAAREGTQEFEWQTYHRNGSPVWWQSYLTPVRFAGVTRIMGQFVSITDRKQAEEMTQRSIASLQSLVGILQYETKDLQAFLTHAVRRAVTFNKSQCGQLFVYEQAEERYISTTYACDSSETTPLCGENALWQQALERLEPALFNHLDPKENDGLSRLLTVPLIHDGRVVAMFGMVNRDTPYREADTLELTVLLETVWHKVEKLRAEDARRERTRYQHAILQTTPDGFYILDHEGRLIEVNHAYCEMSGYTRDELLQMRVHQLDVDDDQAAVKARLRQIIEQGAQTFERRHRRRDGSIFPVEMSVSFLEERGGQFICFCRDLTERHQREAQEAEISGRLHEAVRAANVGLWDWDLTTDTLFLSSQWKAQLGYQDHELKSDLSQWRDRLHPDDAARANAAVEAALQQPHKPYSQEFRLRHKDGSYRWFLTQGSIKVDEAGTPYRFLGSHIDVTEEKERAEQVSLLGEILDEAPALITIHDDTDRILFANQRAILQLGHQTADQLRSRPWHDIQREDNAQALTGEPAGDQTRYETCWHQADGSAFPVEVQARRIQWQSAPAILTLATDISERRAASEALSHYNEHLRYIIEHANGAVAVHDRDLRYVYVSQQYLEQYELNDQDIIGNHHYEVFPDLPQKWRDVHQRVLAGAVERSERDAYPKANGSLEWARWECRPWYDADGEIGGIVIYTEIITERVEAEQALRDSESRLRAIAETAMDAIIGMDPNGQITYWNPAAERIFGYSDDEVMSHDLHHLLAPQRYLEQHQAAYPDFLRSGAGGAIGSTIEMAGKTKDGREIPVELSLSSFEQPDGWHAVGVIRDITSRKQAEAALIESEERTRRKLEAVLDPDEDLGELALADIINTREIQELMEDLHQMTGLGVSIVDQQGDRLVSVGRQQACQLFHQCHPDSRRHCEECECFLTEGLQPYGYKTSQCKNGLWEIATPITIGEQNLGTLFFGQFIFTDQEPPPAFFRDLARQHGYDEEAYLAAIARVPRWTQKKVRHVMDFYSHFTQFVSRLSYGNLKLARILDEHRRSELALRQFKTVFDVSNVGVTIITLDHRIEYINRCMARAHGYEPEELVGESISKLHDPKSKETYKERVQDLQQHGAYAPMELSRLHRDGSTFPMLVAAVVVKDENGQPHSYAATGLDIREQKELELRLTQAQKMESVGRLAGGVAHDFNNMLAVIIGRVELLLNTPAHQRRDQGLREILSAAQRSAELTRQLLAYARRQVISPKHLDLNQAISHMLTMLRRLIGENITLNWEPWTTPCHVLIDPNQIDQILANLCVNAKDAIGRHGHIHISTRLLTGSPPSRDLPSGEYVRLSIRDDGCGMAPKTAANIFEPFFTTKGVGEGTGLGLATVYGIIKQNKGAIEVESQLDQGTTFHLYLPVTAPPPDQRRANEPTAIPQGQGETILLVEDEQLVLKLASEVLEDLGYVVIPCANSTQAIELAQAHRGEIDLLITDVVMPRLNGWELVEKLKTHYPQLRFLFISGYPANTIPKHHLLNLDRQFLQKPFNMEGLANRVRDLLDDNPR